MSAKLLLTISFACCSSIALADLAGSASAPPTRIDHESHATTAIKQLVYGFPPVGDTTLVAAKAPVHPAGLPKLATGSLTLERARYRFGHLSGKLATLSSACSTLTLQSLLVRLQI